VVIYFRRDKKLWRCFEHFTSSMNFRGASCYVLKRLRLGEAEEDQKSPRRHQRGAGSSVGNFRHLEDEHKMSSGEMVQETMVVSFCRSYGTVGPV
jgi:hypothetical protein